MDFVVKNTEKTDEKMRKQESKFKQLEALTTGMINPIKNCSIKPNHWKAKHGSWREWMWVCFGFTTEARLQFMVGKCSWVTKIVSSDSSPAAHSWSTWQ